MIINNRPYSTAYQSTKVIVLQAPMPLPSSEQIHPSPTISWITNNIGSIGQEVKPSESSGNSRKALQGRWATSPNSDVLASSSDDVRWAWCVGETGSHADAPAPNCWWVRLGLLVNWVHLLLSSGDAPAEWKEDQQIKSLGNNLLEEMSAWFPPMSNE